MTLCCVWGPWEAVKDCLMLDVVGIVGGYGSESGGAVQVGKVVVL